MTNRIGTSGEKLRDQCDVAGARGDAAQRSCLVPAGAIIDRGNRQKPPGLGRISRMPGRQAAGLGVKIGTEWQGGHGIAPCFPP